VPRLSGSAWPRFLAALILLVGASVLAQIPDVGTSSEQNTTAVVTTTAASATATTSTTSASPQSSTTSPPTGAIGAKSQQSSQSAGPLALVGDQPRAVAFNHAEPLPNEPKQQALVAEVPLVVQVPEDADGTVSVTYTADTDGAREPLRSKLELSPNHAIPYIAVAPAAAKAGEELHLPVTGGAPATLALRLALQPSANLQQANGTFRITHKPAQGNKAAGALTVRVQGARPQVRFTPDKVRLRITRALGPIPCCLLRDDAHVQLLGAGPAALRAMGAQQVRLSNERNGELIGTLRFHPRPQLAQDAEFHVDQVNATGKYEGGLPLDPAGSDTTSVPVVAEVQDAFYLPLAWLAIFAFLGGYLVNRWNQRRRREILRATLRRAADQHHRDRQGVRGLFDLDEDLGLNQSNWPERSKQQPNPDPSWKSVQRLYWDIGEATTDQDFTTYASRVEAIVNEVDRWRRIATDYQDLRTEVDRAELSDGDAALLDSLHLLEGLQNDPGPGQATDKSIRELADQQRILRRYAQLRGAWEQLAPFQQEAVPGSNPATVYVRMENRQDDTAWSSLLLALSRALGDVRRAAQLEHPPPAPEHQPAIEMEELQAIRVASPETANAIARLAWRQEATTRYLAMERAPIVIQADSPRARHEQDEDALVETPQQRPARDTRSWTHILAGVRRWDWLVAAATALVTMIAFLLPTYAGHTFGSWEDYLRLATLAFLGSVATGGLVLNWSLFPQFRSYSADSVNSETKRPGA
jgi:hypothetical protein